MSDLSNIHKSQPLTMSSLEIANLCGKEHRNVMRDIRAMLEELHGADRVLSFEQTVERPNPSGGNPIKSMAYLLPKRETMILISGYRLDLRATIIDRWQKLEEQVAQPAPTQLTRMDILKLAMESEEARIKAEAERDHAIATKAHISSSREASVMGKLSVASKKISKLEDALGSSTRQATVKAVESMTGRQYPWRPLRDWCKANGVSPVHIPDPQYGHTLAYPMIAWKSVYQVDLE